MIVVDVTVLGYLLFPGPHSEEVEQLRRLESEWIAPQLWRSELLNVLWKYARRGDLSLGEALLRMEAAEHLLRAGTYTVPDWLVLSMAVASGCTAYDCHYAALARHLGLRLLTHDKQLLTAFPDLALSPAHYPSTGGTAS